MVHNFFRRTRECRHRRVTRCRLYFEPLEDRTLLSVSPAGPESGWLGIDPESFDSENLLVRFRADGAVCAEILGGTEVGPSFSALAGLRRVQLLGGVDVETALAAYRANPLVLYAEPDYRVHLTATPNDPRFAELWGLDNLAQTGGTLDADIDAPEAWDVTTGSGQTVVAVIDTGVDYNHPDLAANIWTNAAELNGRRGVDDDGNGYVDDIHGYDFMNRDGDPMDDNNHGTHVAGTIGAVGNNGTGVAGVNWAVQIMALKFIGANGNGSISDAIEAIGYAVANGATLSNNSWGFYGSFSQALFDAIAGARSAGHIFVSAAGNGNIFGIGQDNDATPFYPASFDLDNIVAVAALDDNDALAGFSNFGAHSVDLGAPGVSILSTTRNDTYSTFSGTSMATPHVTGVAALVTDLHPDWTYGQVINQVLWTSDPVSALQGKAATEGRLNAAAAVGNPVAPPPVGTLPLAEDFDDGVADYFQARSGTWTVGEGRYHVTPPAGSDGVSTLRIGESLPPNLDVRAAMNADTAVGEYFSNAFVIFDYQTGTDFKFAGAYVGGDQWLIGHRVASGWVADAAVGETIDAGTDYSLQVLIEGGSAQLLVGGVVKVSHTFADSLTDGKVGLGTNNAFSRFDDVLVQEYVPPPPPPAGTLPLAEDFADGVADFLDVRSGAWTVSGGRYHVTPSAGSDAVSTLRIAGALPLNLELRATFSADAAAGGYFSNAFVIFDYQSATDFKFAGAYVGGDQWLIGHRVASGWVTDTAISETIDAAIDYNLRVFLEGSRVRLLVGGTVKVSHTFADSLTDGQVGLGTNNAVSHFDNVLVQALPYGTLPLGEDFADGVADFFEGRSGQWRVVAGRYQVTPTAGTDGISTLRIGGTLPPNLELQAAMNADPAGGGYFSNAFVIFDYQTATDFKFAGAYVGGDQWVIGRRVPSGWVADVTLAERIDANTDYSLQVILESNRARLLVGGVAKASRTFADAVTDGQVGLGTNNAVSRFDNVLVQAWPGASGAESSSAPSNFGTAGQRQHHSRSGLIEIRPANRVQRPDELAAAALSLAATLDPGTNGHGRPEPLLPPTRPAAHRIDDALSALAEEGFLEVFDGLATLPQRREFQEP